MSAISLTQEYKRKKIMNEIEIERRRWKSGKSSGFYMIREIVLRPHTEKKSLQSRGIYLIN